MSFYSVLLHHHIYLWWNDPFYCFCNFSNDAWSFPSTLWIRYESVDRMNGCDELICWLHGLSECTTTTATATTTTATMTAPMAIFNFPTKNITFEFNSKNIESLGSGAAFIQRSINTHVTGFVPFWIFVQFFKLNFVYPNQKNAWNAHAHPRNESFRTDFSLENIQMFETLTKFTSFYDA